MGIRKDIKKFLEDLELTAHRADAVYIDDVIQRLEETLRKNEKKKTLRSVKREYIVVKSSGVDDEGDTFEAIKDGYELPKTGYKYVKVLK